MAVLYPKRIQTGFALFFGSVYFHYFDFGIVSSVSVDGASLALGTSSSLSVGQFFYDFQTQEIYIRLSDSSSPAGKMTVIEYEIHVGTKDFDWYRTPLDESSYPTFYEPFIVRSPEIKTSVSGTVFGFAANQKTQIVLSNATRFFEKHVYDSTFNKCRILVYRVLKELTLENIKLVYSGYMGSVSFQESSVSVQVFNGGDILEKEWRNTGHSFASVALFPKLDLQRINKAINSIYGVATILPFNISYVAQNQTTTDNRDYLCVGETLSDISKTVSVSPASTTTRTYLSSVSGLMIDDSVWIDKASDEFVNITAVGSNYIEHAALSAACSSGDLVKRSFIGWVKIVKDKVTYSPKFGRDYSSLIASTHSGFSFTTTLEANLVIPSTLSALDKVFCKVYGKVNTVTLGGNPFSVNDTQTGTLTNCVAILVDVLKRAGVTESSLDIPAFQHALTVRPEALGFKIPLFAETGFPFYKTIITEILKSCLLNFFVNDDGKFSVYPIEPLSAEDFTATDSEIVEGSSKYSFDYSDVYSDFDLEYNFEPVSSIGDASEFWKSELKQSQIAKHLHSISRTFKHKTLLFKAIDAERVCKRISFILGDRSGEFSMILKGEFFSTQIGSVFLIEKEKLPGFEYETEVLRNRKMIPVSVVKTLKQVNIDLDDQKGIEENSAQWL